MREKLKCFIASAFGRDDVDRIYDKAIRLVLKKLDIKPLRVDRVEHNDDIDDKIFSLLDESDFCIADLTYARPSAYFEAGHAAGSGKPVIYTARSDHFKARDSDSEGNLRIHFDLQMKNTISWVSADDDFRKRLSNRIKKVISPLIREQQEKDAEEVTQNSFAKQSQDSQLSEITKAALEEFRKADFRLRPTPDGKRGTKGNHVFLIERVNNGRFQQVAFFSRPSITRHDFSDLSLWLLFSRRSDHPKVKGADCVIVMSYLHSVSHRQIAKRLPLYKTISDGVMVASVDRTVTDIPTTNFAAVFDKISSRDEMKHRIKDLINVLTQTPP